MIRKVPVIGYRITLSDIISGFKGFRFRNCEEKFEKTLSAFIPSKHVYLTNSGTSAIFIILQALKKKSTKREVILPAHTAACLVVAIKKAGLKPVLCDISMQDFNMNIESVRDVITPDTLCVICVHMFGIPVRNVKELKNTLPDDIYLIEDCAQALGSRAEGDLTGSIGDAGIYSFNKGKNLPTYGGGAIFTNLDELSVEIEHITGESREAGLMQELYSFLKFVALSAAFRPFFYSLLYPFIVRFKQRPYSFDFSVKRPMPVQAQLGDTLFKRFDTSCMNRHRNAMMIISALRNAEGIMLPRIENSLKPAFNRLPLVVKDSVRKKKIEAALQESGIESSNMDVNPLHHIFDLGYDKEAFKDVAYFADHLITLPVHPLLTDNDLNNIVKAVASTA
jgi:dTDP-4-amino-4,6-dideoxygalactose transaminase